MLSFARSKAGNSDVARRWHSMTADGQRICRRSHAFGWATAPWDVRAHVLSQQDDECAQSKLFGESLAKLDQGQGQF